MRQSSPHGLAFGVVLRSIFSTLMQDLEMLKSISGGADTVLHFPDLYIAILMQDLEMLQPISWGAVIIDQCQGSAMSMLLSQIKVLVSDMRLLIFRQLEV